MNKKNQNPWMSVLAIVAMLVVAIFIFSTLIDAAIPEPSYRGLAFDLHRALEFREAFEFLKLLLTSINAILLIYLLYTYVSVYQEVRSQFSMGLIIIGSALLAHTIAASPLVSQFFGFHGTGLGPFDVIPSFFTLIAAIVLIYLSEQ